MIVAMKDAPYIMDNHDNNHLINYLKKKKGNQKFFTKND